MLCNVFILTLSYFSFKLIITQQLPYGSYDASPCHYVRNTVDNQKTHNCAVIGFYGWANDNWYNTPNWKMTDDSSIDFEIYLFHLWYDFEQIVFGWHNTTDTVDLIHSYITVTTILQSNSVRWTEDVNISLIAKSYPENDGATIEAVSSELNQLLITNVKVHIEWNYNATDGDGVYPTYLLLHGLPRTFSPTMNPTVDPTYDPTNDPTRDPTNEPTVDPTIDPTMDPTFDPTSDPTFDPTRHPTVEPTEDPTHDPTYDPTVDPTMDPTTYPTNDPTAEPTFDPTIDPTRYPTIDPTIDPTTDPTKDPTIDPTVHPTSHPTPPTTDPTHDPTTVPTKDPTNAPTIAPTASPTDNPTFPTEHPTNDPTIDPTMDPTSDPTADPTFDPTGDPTAYPTTDPTSVPTSDPTRDPTGDPTNDPTRVPTPPTMAPTSSPSAAPTISPSMSPTSHPTFSIVCNYTSNFAETCEYNVDDQVFCCSYLAATNHYISNYLNETFMESSLNQTQTLKFVTQLRNVECYMIVLDCLLVAIAVAVALYLTAYSKGTLYEISLVFTATLSFSTFIDIVLTFSSIGIIDSNKLIPQMEEMYTHHCYGDVSSGDILRIETSLRNILTFDSLEVVSDIIGLGALLYVSLSDDGNRKRVKTAQLLHITLFLCNIILTFVNYFSNVSPSYEGFRNMYNNNNSLCYYALNGENFNIKQYQGMAFGIGIPFTLLGLFGICIFIMLIATESFGKSANDNEHDVPREGVSTQISMEQHMDINVNTEKANKKRSSSDEFEINMFSQEKHLTLKQKVTKTHTIEHIKNLYKAEADVHADTADIHLYYKSNLLVPETTLKDAGIVDDRHLISVKFGTNAGVDEFVD